MAARVLRTRASRLGLAGGAVTLAAYSGLLVVSVRKETYVEAGWTPTATERLRSYGALAAERSAAFLHEVALPLTWILALAALPLAVLSLIWPARRHAGDSRGRVLPFRPGAQAPEPTDASEPAPLREAG